MALITSSSRISTLATATVNNRAVDIYLTSQGFIFLYA
ncbi:hypothetical protein EPYR_02705 [Erwinia pyrifoliae DSM 12163]|nr:hypothetical protein EPYR_02705 [Erwinia pyrifoliae DSM 12163]